MHKILPNYAILVRVDWNMTAFPAERFVTLLLRLFLRGSIAKLPMSTLWEFYWVSYSRRKFLSMVKMFVNSYYKVLVLFFPLFPHPGKILLNVVSDPLPLIVRL